MKYLFIKNKKYIKKFLNLEFNIIKLKYIIYNENIMNFIRQFALNNLNILLKNKKVFNQIKLRCILTNKSRSLFKFFKLYRLQLRFFNSFGKLIGIKKYND
jgi:ribosomal protein S14